MRGDAKMWATAGRYSALGLEMALGVVFGMYGGRYIDDKFGMAPTGSYVGLGLGMGAAFVSLFRTARIMRREQLAQEQQAKAAAEQSGGAQ